MGNGSIRVSKGKVFYREWLNCGVERAFLEGEWRQAAVQGSEEDLRNAPRIMTAIEKPQIHSMVASDTERLRSAVYSGERLDCSFLLK